MLLSGARAASCRVFGSQLNRRWSMKMVWSVMIMVFLGAVIVTGCKKSEKSGTEVTSQEVKKEAREAYETTMVYTEQKKEGYQKQIEAKLKEYDRKIEELEARAKKLKKQAREEINKEIRMIKKERQDLARKAEEMKTASGKAWEDIKAGVDKAAADLEKAIGKASKHFE
jgi:predicted RNase H-like nuclease (RuvC/YqgF family)